MKKVTSGKRAIRIRRTQAERSEETRRRLIGAFVEIIGEAGLAKATSIAAAQRAGVTRGAIQHHFASRDALTAEIVFEITERIDARPFKLDGGTMPLARRVDRIVDAYWEVYGSKQYLSALEIEATAKYDRALCVLLKKRFRVVAPMRDSEWLELFHDTSLSRERSLSLRRLMVDTLRGLAMRKLIFEPHAEGNQVALLKEMILAAFEGGASRTVYPAAASARARDRSKAPHN